LFLQTFEDGHSAAKNRVNAETWGKTFAEEVIQSNSILPNSINLTKNTPLVKKNNNISINSNPTFYKNTNSNSTTINTSTIGTNSNTKSNDDMPGWKAILILLGVVLFFIFLYNVSPRASGVLLIIIYLIYRFSGK
jgi:hypothetical protein